MAASVHSWQFVHSATSMIMFHFCITCSCGLDPAFVVIIRERDDRVTTAQSVFTDDTGSPDG